MVNFCVLDDIKCELIEHAGCLDQLERDVQHFREYYSTTTDTLADCYRHCATTENCKSFEYDKMGACNVANKICRGAAASLALNFINYDAFYFEMNLCNVPEEELACHNPISEQ